MQTDQAAQAVPHLDDEVMHPHTEWMLKQPLAKYVLDPQPVYLKHAKPTACGGVAAASGSPSGASNDASGHSPVPEADTATQHDPSPDTTQTPRLPHSASVAELDQAQTQSDYPRQDNQQEDAEALHNGPAEATPALSGFSASQSIDAPAGDDQSTPAGK